MNEAPRPSDLHGEIAFLDHTLQDLFGFGLKLEYCLNVLDDAPLQARTGLEDVVSGLDETAALLREHIHRLDGSRNLSPENQ
jgi:hypothetical protein